jgi:hypothetical protein
MDNYSFSDQSTTPNSSHGKDTPSYREQSPYIEVSPYVVDGGNLIGVIPSRISLEDILALGHPPSPIKSIRAKCLECCNEQESEVRKCLASDCPLWPLRMGHNTYHPNSKRTLPSQDKEVGQ